MKNLEQKFESFYKKGNWGGGSGFGSSLDNTEQLRAFLDCIVSCFSIKSIKDLGCGDFSYMKNTSFINNINYFGYDIVESVIYENKKQYETEKIKFFCQNILKEPIPFFTDLTLIKDVLQHLSFDSIFKFLKNTVGYQKYIIVIEDFTEENKDIIDGSYRGLNLVTLCDFSDPIFIYSTYWENKNIHRQKAVYILN